MSELDNPVPSLYDMRDKYLVKLNGDEMDMYAEDILSGFIDFISKNGVETNKEQPKSCNICGANYIPSDGCGSSWCPNDPAN